MNDLLLGTLGVSGAFVGYVYAGYPALLWLRTRGVRKVVSADPVEWPLVSVVIPAYNEEVTIARALDHVLASDYPADRLQVIVVSDASTDATDAIVAGYASRGVELVRMDTRGGKTRNENAVIPRLQGEIVINTDAAMRVHPAAIRALVREVTAGAGVASCRDVSVHPGDLVDAPSGEGAYVGYEMWVRELETEAGGIVGASGCLYAMRADLHRRRIRDDLSRDFASALTAREAGYRAVSVPDAICYVPHTTSLRHEYRRKVRTIDRGLQTLYDKRQMLNPWQYGAFAWKLFSHKICRWLLPFAGGLAVIALAGLAVNHPWARVAMLGCVGVGIAGVIGWYWPQRKPIPASLAICAYFIAGNVAVVHAWVRAIRGTGTAVWEPTRRESVA